MSSLPAALGQYQIIREIARSNDIVYEAYDPLMNRRVAIKELAMPNGATPQQKEERISRFKREAQAAGTLNHPNIMTVFSFAEDGDRIFMAMEYLDGNTLRNEIDTKGPLSQDRAIEITKAILAGLDHAHSKGVIHRDIKPDNIQILSNGQIKITDFGIARLIFQPNLTMDGQVFGTPSYMSPEQVVGRDIDQRSDIFSVGVVLYELLAGRKPFGGDSVVTITYAIMNKEPDHLPNVGYALWQVVTKALEKSTPMRFASAKDMIQALDDATMAEPGIMPNALPSVFNNLPPSPYQQPYPQQPNAQQGPINTPYGYGPPPGANPYGNQYNQPPTPPPQVMPAYSYNPYQTGGGAMPPHTPQMGMPLPGMPPPGQIPVYYPPPPRQPLLKPETTAFLKKLAVTFLVLGTLFLLLLVGTQALVQAFNRMSAEQEAQKARNALVADSTSSPEEQLEKWLKLKEKSPNGQDSAQTDAAIAALYEKIGKNRREEGKFEEAESNFRKAADVDSHNPAPYTDLGDLYSRRASGENDLSARAELYGQSSREWLKAYTQETNTQQKQMDLDAAAESAFLYGTNARNTGNAQLMQDSRTLLEEIEPRLSPGDRKIRIAQLIETLR